MFEHNDFKHRRPKHDTGKTIAWERLHRRHGGRARLTAAPQWEEAAAEHASGHAAATFLFDRRVTGMAAPMTIGAQRTEMRPAVSRLFRAMGPVAALLSIFALLCFSATVVCAQSDGEIAILGGNNQTNPLHSFAASPLSVTIWNTCDVDGCIEGTVTFTVQDPTYAVLCLPDHKDCIDPASQATYNTSGGEVDVDWMTVSKAGAFQITATNNATGHSVTFDLTNTAGPPASIVTILGTPQSASTGTAFANALGVDVRDADGNHTGNGLVVTFTAPTGEPTARFSGSTTGQGTVESLHGFMGALSPIPTAGQVGAAIPLLARRRASRDKPFLVLRISPRSPWVASLRTGRRKLT
jgi:hypothetical protein